MEHIRAAQLEPLELAVEVRLVRLVGIILDHLEQVILEAVVVQPLT